MIRHGDTIILTVRHRCSTCGCSQAPGHVPGSPTCLADRRERDTSRGQ